MNREDAPAFKRRLAGCFALYSKDLSDIVLSVWWECMKPYDLEAVADALNRHAVNPDNGQFVPKPADIVKLISGGTQDGALLAWTKVERGIRSVGPYQSAVFDDAAIHAVLSDMGGWVSLCNVSDDELPFKRNEFVTRYRGFRSVGRIDVYPKHLPGIAEAQNSQGGYRIDPPIMIGNPAHCRLVFKGGSDTPMLPFIPMVEAA